MAPLASFQVKGSKQAKPLGLFAESDDENYSYFSKQGADQLQAEGDEAALQGNWSLAIRKWDEALANKPDNAHILHEQKAQVYLELGDSWRAIQSATAATQLQPDWPEGHLTLARAQLHFGEPELSLKHMELVLRLQPENIDAAQEVNTIRMLVIQRKEQGILGKRNSEGQCRLKVVSKTAAGFRE